MDNNNIGSAEESVTVQAPLCIDCRHFDDESGICSSPESGGRPAIACRMDDRLCSLSGRYFEPRAKPFPYCEDDELAG